jgi:hypothetical protein
MLFKFIACLCYQAPVPGQFSSDCTTSSCLVRSQSLLLSSFSSIIGLLWARVTVSGTGICRRRQAGSYVSFNLEFTPPRIVLPPSRRSRSCRSVAEAEAGPHASILHAAAGVAVPTLASDATAAAAAAGDALPPSTLALATRRASLRDARRGACRI